MLLHHIDKAIEVTKPAATCDDVELRDRKLSPEEVEVWISGNILMAQSIAGQIHLHSTWDRVWEGAGPFWVASRVGLTWQEAYSELRVLRQAIESDLERSTFAFIPRHNAELLDRMEQDWQAVWVALPNTKTDIKNGIECYALDESTASVFHMMRAVEWGLRAFCHHLRFKNVKSTKKSGEITLTPIEYLTWDGILNQLRGKVNEKINTIKRGAKRQELQEFYHQSVSEVEGFKDAWRNHVMHSRKIYSPEDAMAVVSHVRRFLNLLVSNGVTKV